MSAIHTWFCFLLWISFSSEDKTPDATVTCFMSQECVLPCSFEPAGEETVEWFRQDVMIYKFQRRSDAGKDDEDDEDGERSDSAEHFKHEHVAGRASVFPLLVSRGNATLILKRSSLKDRGTYRCHTRTDKGEHNAKVIVKVEAPVRGVFLELSRLSGYEEMKCVVRDVFPAPRVTWSTEPSTFESLRPVTRMLADKMGLYTVDSRLKMLEGRPDLIYICKVTTSYGGQAWTASLRERELKGTHGRDLSIPCSAPAYLSQPSLRWSFSNGEDSSHILTYDSRSGDSVSTPPWDSYVELDGFRVPFGDGSLRLMDPKHGKHSGSYTCVFSMPYSTHTERNVVIIDGPAGQRSSTGSPSHWWILGLLIALLILGLAGMLVYMKLRGRRMKPKKDPEDTTELHLVKDAAAADVHLRDSSPPTSGGANGQSSVQSGSQLT